MSFTNRFFIYAPFALFVALALGLTVRWFWQVEAFSRRLDALNGHRLMPGVTLHFSSKKLSGFPFRLDAEFRDVEIDVQTRHGPSAWRAENFALHRLNYSPDKTIFEAAGRQHIVWTDLEGRRHSVEYAAGSTRASEIEDEAGLVRFDLATVVLGSPAFHADEFQFHLRRDRERDAIDLFVSADGLGFASPLLGALGKSIDRFTLSATATRAKSLASLQAGLIAWPGALAQFKAADGQLRLDDVEIGFSRLDASGKGLITLDSAARPTGVLDFKIARFAKFIDAARTYAAPKPLTSAILDRAVGARSNAMGRSDVTVRATDGILFADDAPIGMLTPIY